MKKITYTLLTTLLLSTAAHAQITVSNFVMSTNSIAFDVSGTIPLNIKTPDLAFYLLIIETPLHREKSFLFQDAEETRAISANFTGTQSVPDAWYYQNDIDFEFEEDLAPGEAINGRFSATFADNIFNPENGRVFKAVWGYTDQSPDRPGSFLTYINVANIDIPDELYFTYAFEPNYYDGKLAFKYIVDAPATGEDYDLERSTDLINWQWIDSYDANGIPKHSEIGLGNSDHTFYRWVKKP